MDTLPGRIRRISLDAGTPTNYTLQATTSYNALIPAESPSVWGDAAALVGMDQALSIPVPPAVEVVGNMGVLVTFDRFPEYFKGVVVKVKPTYDTDVGQDPYLEFWTYNSVEASWTIRCNVQLRSGFVGCPSGKAKYFEDFILDAPLSNVTKLWVTLNAGVVSGPVMSWIAVHVFGSCRNVPVIDGSCENDPTIDCIDPTPCERNPESCLVPVQDCEDLDPSVCEIPTPEWPTPPPPEDLPTPKWKPPDFPIIDLCSATAIAAYKESLTPEQLAFFTELLDAAELPCLTPIEDPPVRQPDPVAPINTDPDGEKVLPKQPIEVYVDPETVQPATDPKKKPPGRDPRQDELVDQEFHLFFAPGQALITGFFAGLALSPTAVQSAVNEGEMQYIVYGVDAGLAQDTSTQFARLDTISLAFRNLMPGHLVGVQTYEANFLSYTSSRVVAYIGGQAISIGSAGYTTGYANRRFSLSTPAFGVEDATAIPGHKTFTRGLLSAPTVDNVLSFSTGGTAGDLGGLNGYGEKFTFAHTENIGTLQDPIYVVFQSSDFGLGFYMHVVVRRSKLDFPITLVASATSGTADHRSACLAGTQCSEFGCSIG